MKKKPKNIPSPYKSNGIPIYRDTTDSSLFENGGKIDKPKYYQYKDHKDQYMKKGNQWYISNQFTDFNFQPIKDPKGTRAKELNKNAKEFNIEEQNTLEGRLNKSLGNPMDRAYRAAEYFAMPGEDPTDNFRHPIAGRYTAEAIEKAVNTGYPIIDKTAAFLGANALGIGHEVGSLIKGKRPLSTTIPEAAEDIYNNFIGTTVGLSSMSPQQKTNYLLRLSDNNQLPDGYGPSATHAPMYWKNPQGKGAYNSKYKNGGELLAQPYPNSFFASSLGNYYDIGGDIWKGLSKNARLSVSPYNQDYNAMLAARNVKYELNPITHGYGIGYDKRIQLSKDPKFKTRVGANVSIPYTGKQIPTVQGTFQGDYYSGVNPGSMGSPIVSTKIGAGYDPNKKLNAYIEAMPRWEIGNISPAKKAQDKYYKGDWSAYAGPMGGIGLQIDRGALIGSAFYGAGAGFQAQPFRAPLRVGADARIGFQAGEGKEYSSQSENRGDKRSLLHNARVYASYPLDKLGRDIKGKVSNIDWPEVEPVNIPVPEWYLNKIELESWPKEPGSPTGFLPGYSPETGKKLSKKDVINRYTGGIGLSPTPFADGGPLHDRDNETGKLLNSTYASALGRMFRDGGYFDHGYSLPEDSFKQGGRGLKDSIYASTGGQYPAPYKYGGSVLSMSNTPQLEGEGKDLTYPDGAYVYANGGYTVRRSNDRKGKTHVVIGPDGTKKYFGDPKMGERSKSKHGKEAFYARHKHNLNSNPYFRAYARATWETGGQMNTYDVGGPIYTYPGRPDAEYKKVNNKWFISAPGTNGFIPINDPTGKRTALLNKQAVIQPRAKNYDPLLNNQPVVAESTVPKQYLNPQAKQVTAQKMAQEQMQQQVVDQLTREQVQKNPILTEQQKQEILLDPRKLREYNYLAQENPDKIQAGTERTTDELAYDILTNPFTAAEYAISGGGVENMPRNINEMRMAGIDPGVVEGRNLVGNALNATTNLIDAGDKLVRNVGEGDYLGAAAEALRFVPAGLGAYAGTKTLAKQAERLGVGNVVKGKAPVKDLFQRADLINVNTPEDLLRYQADLSQGALSPTRNRYYSSLDNPDALKYAKGQEEVFVHQVPQTKAAAAGKSLVNVKPEGAGLIARQRSIPTVDDVENLIASGQLSGYSPETLQGLREVAANPEGYWNLDIFKSNPELQTLVKDPMLVNPAEHLLPRPAVEDFTLMPVTAIGASRPALIEGKEIINKALESARQVPVATKPVALSQDNNNFKSGGAMNFKSKGAYQKWLAYGHASGEFAKTPGNQPVSIKGKAHKVEHQYGGNLYAAGGSFNNPGFKALPANVQAKIKANSFADGGPMAQLTEFNAGGTHEQNPIGGIPQGMAPNGQINLVEQGETKLNSEDYIFSDSLKVDKETANAFGLSKNLIGKTFAEASKTLNRPKSRRENDTIEENAIKRDLDNLMGAQEFYKQEQIDNKLQELQSLAPDLYNQMMQGMQSYQPMEMGEGMPGEMTEQEVIMDETGEPISADQIPPEMLAQMPEAQAGMPVMAYGGHMYKCGGKMYNFGGQMYNMGGSMYNYGGNMYNYGGRMFEGGGGLTAEEKARIAQGSYLYKTPDTTTQGPTAQQKAENISGQIGQYAGLAAQGVNAGMTFADDTATSQQKADAAYDTGVAVASAINPVVGGLIGVGDMIGEPLKENVFEKYNDEGELQNENAAKAGAVLGSLFNPYKAITTRSSYKGGWTDFTGDKYVDYLEDQKRKELGISEDSTPTYSSQLGAVMNSSYMDKGGMLKRADGSYSPRGLWDNIRANKGSGKKPTKEMLEQEKKIKSNSMNQGGYLAPQHKFNPSNPTYKDNAGPQGQLMTNLYAEGGGLGDPPVSVNYYNPVPKRTDLKYQGDYFAIPAGIFPIPTTTSNRKSNKPIITEKGSKSVIGSPYADDYYRFKTYQADNRGKLRSVQDESYYTNNVGGERVVSYPSRYVTMDTLGYSQGRQNFPVRVVEKNIADGFGGSYDVNEFEATRAQVPSLIKSMKNQTGLSNKEKVAANAYKVEQNRKKVEANREKVLANQRKVLGFGMGGQMYGDGGQMYNESLASYSPEMFNMLGMGQQLGQQMYEPLDHVAKYGGKINANYFDNGGRKKKSLSEQVAFVEPIISEDEYFPNPIEPNVMGTSPYMQNAMDQAVGVYGNQGVPAPIPTPVVAGVPTQRYYSNPEEELLDEFLTAETTKYGTVPTPVIATGPVAPARIDLGNEYESQDLIAKYPSRTGVKPAAPLTAKDVLEKGQEQDELIRLQNAVLNAETQEELDAATKAYQSALQRLNTEMAANNVDMTFKRKLPRDLMMFAPAAYNIATGLFEKVNQLNPSNYMVRADLQGTEMNIEPIRRRIQQNYAQALNAVRNAGASGGNYMTNVQQLAAAQNAAVSQAEIEKINADITSAERAKMANKQIEAGNIQTRQQIEDTNRRANAMKRAALTTGMTQLADIARNAYELDAQKALAKAISPTFGEKIGPTNYKALQDLIDARNARLEEEAKKKETTKTEKK